ncbi:Rab5 GDP/GTP exchange factor [Striga asiatica]|uniref:Rab5 GDP/GTP exchange factor n=1 Tax=Striga asiatica TaxID=4170 RepID=A0A5A7PCD2_STRAF|nr:Rab5 GDP/GTP exchange factor [Striga asiatica]
MRNLKPQTLHEIPAISTRRHFHHCRSNIRIHLTDCRCRRHHHSLTLRITRHLVRHVTKFKGTPFFWKKIPKHQLGSNKKEYSEHLPLRQPPPRSRSIQKRSPPRKEIDSKISPFFAALVECSNGGNDNDAHHGTNYGW